MVGKFGGRVWIRISDRFRVVGCNKRLFSTNNSERTAKEPKNGDDKAVGPLTHHDSYRDLDKLDFMTAAKILFTTPPKQKKFGLDFHLIQLFFVCLPSLAVYLVAQYARHEMKKMDAELERKKQAEEDKKREAAEEEAAKGNPQLLEVKERLDILEKTLKEIVVESKNKRSSQVTEKHGGERIEPARISSCDNRSTLKPCNSADSPNKQLSNEKPKVSSQDEPHRPENNKGPQKGVSVGDDEKK